MKQYWAVKEMLLSMRTEGLPNELVPLVREYLRLMYVVGFDACRDETFKHYTRKIGQYDLNLKLIETYDGLRKASRITGFSRDTICRSIREDRAVRGFYWIYIDPPTVT